MLRSYHPMRKQSDKSLDRQAARAKCIRDVAKRDKYRCRAKVKGICTGGYEDVHELVKRSAGGSITDPDNCMAVCRRCHRFLHDNPAEAFDLGFLHSPKRKAESNG